MGWACTERLSTPTAVGAPASQLAIGGVGVIEQVGATITLTATSSQSGVATDVTAAAQWVTNDPTTLAILGPGQVQARAIGGAEVLVTHQGRTAARRVTVASAEDCLPYDPSAMFLWEGTSGGSPTWTLAEPAPIGGFFVYVTFVENNDAQDGLALAQRHTHSCYSGRNYGGADRLSYIVPYWSGGGGPLPTLTAHDCDPYDPARLEIRPDSPGWTVFDGSTRVARLFFETDAARMLVVARAHQARCYIGRGREYPGGRQFATSYFR